MTTTERGQELGGAHNVEDLTPPPRTTESEGWLGTVELLAIPVLCCGVPLLVGAAVATGASGWLLLRGSLLAVPLLVLAAGLLIWRRARTRG